MAPTRIRRQVRMASILHLVHFPGAGHIATRVRTYSVGLLYGPPAFRVVADAGLMSAVGHQRTVADEHHRPTTGQCRREVGFDNPQEFAPELKLRPRDHLARSWLQQRS